MGKSLDSASTSPDTPSSAIAWPQDASVEQLCNWLDNHIRLGHSIRCEELLTHCPRFLDDCEAVLDLIYTEYFARCETGSAPSHEEFYQRFPQWRQQLEHQFQLGTLFDQAYAVDNQAAAKHAACTGGSAPRYRVLKFLARGGIGQVMQAIDTELNREVAIKEIQTQLVDNVAVRERFLREAEITGQLEHPGIVPVYGRGSDEHDRPFYAMRLVRGQSLLDAIQEFHRSAGAGAFRSLRFQNLLRRFLSVCETISYAHSRGVIHRDIKPENILLGPFGETLVVDWGLAKVTHPDSVSQPAGHDTTKSIHNSDPLTASDRPNRLGASTENSPAHWSVELTQSAGMLVGTPAYMSPEQAQGDSGLVSPISDVYSLGATLHMLLTGVQRIPTSDLVTALRAILNDDLPTPRMVNRGVPRGLDAICGKALQQKPANRYASAADLARDIEHYLADEPVTALRDSVLARLIRLTRRHRSLAFSAVVSMMILTVITVIAAVRINRERQMAYAAYMATERGNARLAFDRGYQLLATHQFGEGLLWLQRALTHVPIDDLPMRRVILTNMAAASHHLLIRHAIFENQHSLGVFEFDRDGRFLLTIDHKGMVRYWDPDSGGKLTEHKLPATRILAAHIDAQGIAHIALASRSSLSMVTLEEDAAPVKAWSAKQIGDIHHVALSPDGRCVAVSVESDDQWSVRILDVLDGHTITTIPTSTSSQIIFDSAHSRLVCIDEKKVARFWKWHVEKQAYEEQGRLEGVHRLTVSADGKWVLVGTLKGAVRCYAGRNLKLQSDLGQHLGSVVALTVSPDSQVLVAIWDNGVARSWNLQDMHPACETLRVDRYTSRILFRPHTRQVALLAKPHTVALWQMPTDNPASLPLSISNLDSVEYSRDGSMAIAISRQRYAQLLDGSTGRNIGAPLRHTDVIKAACLNPSGRLALTSSFDGRAILWNTDTAAPAEVQPHFSSESRTVRMNAAAFSPNGNWMATADSSGAIKLWDVATGAIKHSMAIPKCSALKVCFSPCNQRLLAGYNSPDCGVRMWDVETGQLLWTGNHAGAVRCVAISPNGKVAVSAGNDSTAKLWDTASGAVLGHELPARGEIFAARFHPNSSIVATGGYDATIRLWRVPTGEPLGEPMMHEALITDFVFSNDGLRLLSGAVDATARLWDVPCCLPLSPPLPHDGSIMSVALHPLKDIAITGRLWHLPRPLPDEPELIALWTRLATQRTFTSGNNVDWLSPDDLAKDAANFEARVGRSWSHWPE